MIAASRNSSHRRLALLALAVATALLVAGTSSFADTAKEVTVVGPVTV
jgi:hypothetical protein